LKDGKHFSRTTVNIYKMSQAIIAVLLLAVALGVRADPVGDAAVSHHRNEKNVKR
jgi:hypothetical protein